MFLYFFFSSRRRHTRSLCDWSSDVCSSDLDLVLSGKILSVSVPTLSFSQTTTLESRAEVLVIVKVEETRTNRLVWAQTAKGTSEFYVTSEDRKSTRLNSSHTVISYAVFCLK